MAHPPGAAHTTLYLQRGHSVRSVGCSTERNSFILPHYFVQVAVPRLKHSDRDCFFLAGRKKQPAEDVWNLGTGCSAVLARHWAGPWLLSRWGVALGNSGNMPTCMLPDLPACPACPSATVGTLPEYSQSWWSIVVDACWHGAAVPQSVTSSILEAAPSRRPFGFWLGSLPACKKEQARHLGLVLAR